MHVSTAPRPLAATRWRRTGGFGLALALLALTAGGAHAQAQLGTPAPDFTLLGNDGQMHTLSDGFGSKVQLLHMIGYA